MPKVVQICAFPCMLQNDEYAERATHRSVLVGACRQEQQYQAQQLASYCHLEGDQQQHCLQQPPATSNLAALLGENFPTPPLSTLSDEVNLSRQYRHTLPRHQVCKRYRLQFGTTCTRYVYITKLCVNETVGISCVNSSIIKKIHSFRKMRHWIY